jgi:hypothetical protein
MSIQEAPRKPWPRWAICGTERAKFDCWGDVPIGWELEEALNGLSKKEGPKAPKEKKAA